VEISDKEYLKEIRKWVKIKHSQQERRQRRKKEGRRTEKEGEE
jgi:hypothetical protein